MKYGKLFVLIAALVLLGAGHLASAQAQDSANAPAAAVPDRERGLGRRGGFDRPKLNLTADQKTKLKSLREGVRQQVEALRNDPTLSGVRTDVATAVKARALDHVGAHLEVRWR